MLKDAEQYHILKRLHANPEASQRALAEELGVSLGKVNFCLNALIERGFLKVENFRNNKHKRAYVYYLTPKGFENIRRAKLLDTSENTRGRDILWCHPAFANRCAYMHNGKEFICVSLAVRWR